MKDLLVRQEEVDEYLGIQMDEPVQLPIALNVGVVNWNGRKLIDGADLVRTLTVFAERNNIPLLHSIAHQLAMAAGIKPQGG